MNILCAICQDVLEPSNDIFTTPCGHTFHFPCLIQWLENKPSCPQCRQKVKSNQIIRLFFNFANTEAVKEDSFTLQSKIDSLSFQIKLKETELNVSRENTEKLKRQNQGLREEFKNLEKKITEKNSAIHALQEQSTYLKDKCQDYDKVVKDKVMLQSKLETYNNVKALLCDNVEEVDKMLKSTTDPSTLASYVGIMKRELTAGMEKRKELRTSVRRLQHELQTIKMKKESEMDNYLRMIKTLEDNLTISQKENHLLQKKLSSVSEPSNVNSVDSESNKNENTDISRKRENTFKLDSIVPSKKSKNSDEFFDEEYSFNTSNNSDVIFVSPEKKKSKENEENSPYLPTKSKSLLSFNNRNRIGGFSLKPKQIISSNKKSSKERDSSIHFDGFGGHSKVEVYPVPKSSPNKLKRPATDSSKSKKLKLDIGGSKPMDDYVVNLT